MASSSSSSSSSLKPKQQHQVMEMKMEVDQLGRLPDEVVMLIIDKLFHAKTLVRLSMAAKRYSSLVSQTHSLLMDFTLQSESSNVDATSAASTHPPMNYACQFFREKMSAIIRRFKQIKHLHLHVRSSDNTPFAVIPLGSGRRFSQWIAVFGSRLERVHFLAAASVIPNPNPDDSSGSGNASLNNNTSEEEEEEPSDWDSDWDVYWREVFQATVQYAELRHAIIRELVSGCETIESVVYSDNFSGGGGGGGAVFMGKHHVTKLRMSLIKREGNDDDQVVYNVNCFS